MRNLSIKQKSYGIFTILFLVVFISGMVILYSLSNAREDAEIMNALGRQRMLAQEMAQSVFGFSMAKSQEETLVQQIQSLDHYISQMRRIYTESVINKVDLPLSMNPASEPHPAIPYPATFTRMVNESFKKNQGFSANIISEDPVNPDQTLKSELDKEANDFLKNSSEPYFSKIFEEDGKLYIGLYSPDRATVPACVSCHSALQNKKVKLGDILGIRSYKLAYSENVALGKVELNANLNQYITAKTTFEFTLLVMKLGGEFPLDQTFSQWKKVKAIPDAKAQNKISEIEKEFHALGEFVETLLELETNSFLYRRARQEIIAQSNKLGDLSGELVNLYGKVAKRNHENIQLAVVFSGIFALLTLICLAFYMSRLVIRPIQKIAAVLKETAKGNLDQKKLKVETRDEIGILNQSYNELIEKLQRFIRYSEDIHIGQFKTDRSDQEGDFRTSLEKLSAVAKAKQRAEMALREAQIGLETRVKERTSELFQSNETLKKEITRRTAVENLLYQTNAFMSNLLESPTEISIISTGKEGNIIYWNKGAEKMLGYSAGEVVGKRNINFLYPEESKNKEKRQKAAQFVMEHKKAATLTLEEITKSGAKIWARLTLSPMLDKKGDTIGLLGIGENITSQKQAEMDLSLSEERLRSLVANALDGIISINNRGIVESFNHASEKIFGYSKEEVIGKNISMLMPEPYRSQHDGYIERYMATGERRFLGIVRELPGVRKNGEVFPLEISASEVNIGDKPIFLGIARDISERKRSEEALRTSEERARLVIDTAHDAFVSINSMGQIIEWNNKAEEIFGWRRDEVIGKKLSETIVPVSYREQHQAGFKKFMETGKNKILNTRVELAALHREGHEFPVEISISPLPVDGSYHFNAFIHDITERKSMQTQLHHAQKMESIGQLAAGIAHEINTPMQFVGDNTMFLKHSFRQIFDTVKAHDQFLMEGKKGTVSEKMVTEVEASCQNSDIAYLSEEIPLAIKQSLEGLERVSKIVKAMKEFSHPGSEEKIPTDINKAIDTTLTVARNEWKYVAEVVTDFDLNLPLVPCFANDFNQVILNTVVNAAHAIGDVVKNTGDQGTITLSTRQDGDWAEIRIQDTGTGIPANIKSKIFDPFFTTKEVGKGTGQGLSIVHAIVVKKHQGAVSLETEQGKGTTFIFRFPISSTYS